MLSRTVATLSRAAPRMTLRKVPVRNLNLHGQLARITAQKARGPLQRVLNLFLSEYQSATIMREHGVNTPKGGTAKSAAEAEKVFCLHLLSPRPVYTM